MNWAPALCDLPLGKYRTDRLLGALSICGLFLISLCASADPDRASPPNLLVILSDDQGQWALGDYDARIQTPNLSYLAANGVRFDQAIAPSPVCSAARASFYTGRMPSQHGVHDFLSEADSDANDWLGAETLIAEHLAASGYRVGLFGKWHADIEGWRTPPGFDRWLSYDERRSDWQNQYLHTGEVFFSDDGEAISHRGFQASFISDKTIEFMLGRGNKPFAAFVNYTEPHFPFSGLPERLVSRYRDVAGEIIPPGDTSALTPVHQPLSASQHIEAVAQYLAAVTLLDEQVGRLLDALETNNQRLNTVVVYASDHGHMTGQYGLYGKGNATRPQNLYHHSLTIPLVIAGPAHLVSPGQIRNDFVSLVDLFPTLLKFAGAEDAITDYDGPGLALQTLLRGQQPAKPFRKFQYAEYGNARMVSDGRWKLVRYYGVDDNPAVDRWYDMAGPAGERIESDGPDSVLRRQLTEALRLHFARYENDAHSGRRVWTLPRHNAMEPWRP